MCWSFTAVGRMREVSSYSTLVHDRIWIPDANVSEFSDIPAMVPAPGGAIVVAADGICRTVGMDEARNLFRAGRVLIAHAAFVSGRLKTAPREPLFDVL